MVPLISRGYGTPLLIEALINVWVALAVAIARKGAESDTVKLKALSPEPRVVKTALREVTNKAVTFSRVI